MANIRHDQRQVRGERASNRLSLAASTLLVILAPAESVLAQNQVGNGVMVPAQTASEDLRHKPLVGPDSSTELLRAAQEDKNDVFDQDLLEGWTNWKAGITERTGFSFGGDYTAVGLAASSSPGDDTAASGIARIFGSWELLNRGNPNTGSFEFKFENRHSYTDVPPAAFGFEVGYVGTPEPVFSDQDYRTTTLLWKQRFLDDRGIARVGFIDVKDYFDVYPLASPWTGFHNLAFSTGVNTMAILPDGAFGAMAGAYLTDNVYAAASIADASADPTSVLEGVDTFFGDFDTFKTLEIGMTGGGKLFFLENLHLALWQIDESAENGTPDGWGAVASASTLVDDNWLAFARAGWANDGGGVYETSVSTGFGYLTKGRGDLLGVGLNWGNPNDDTFGTDLDDQWTGEAFYRVHLTDNIQVAPSVQLLGDPALNSDKDLISLFGLRARMTF